MGTALHIRDATRASVSLSYVTIAFNVARPFCLMDVSQWLQNVNESVTNMEVLDMER